MCKLVVWLVMVKLLVLCKFVVLCKILAMVRFWCCLRVLYLMLKCRVVVLRWVMLILAKIVWERVS